MGLRSARTNSYIFLHIRSIDGLSETESASELDFLKKHLMQDKYVLKIEWLSVGDLVVWDNTCTLHRATPSEGQYRRDMRRIGVSLPFPVAYYYL